MQLNHQSNKVLITGQSGTGKSTFYNGYILNARYDFKFIFDHEGEFTFRNQLPAASTPEELLEAVQGRGPLVPGWIIYDPGEMYEGDLPSALNFFSEWVFRMCSSKRGGAGLPGTKLFCVDELQLILGNDSAPWELTLCTETGRRYGLDMCLVTQQPNLIHNRVRNQVNQIVAFAQTDQNATKFLEDQGFDPDQVRDLGTGDYILKDCRARLFRRGNLFRSKEIRPPAD